jgi:hypothetical protein
VASGSCCLFILQLEVPLRASTLNMYINIAVVAAWPAPNDINPETTGPSSVVVEITLLVLVTILLAIRLYTRIVISRGFALDDTLILLAYFPAAGFAILAVVGHFAFKWDRHVWDSHPLQIGQTSLKAL